MKKLYLKIIVLFLLSISFAQADYVDAEKDGYKLYRSDIIKIINLASALAGKEIPGAEQWEILRNAVGFFKQKPAHALKNYAVLHKMIKRIDNPKNSDYEYRLAVQAAYHKLHFEWNFYKINGNRGFLPIVKQYMPIYEMNITSKFSGSSKKFFVKNWDGVEVAQDGYYLTTFMVDSMVQVAEFLANSRLTAADKKRVKTWAIKDFKTNPANRTIDYAYYINILLPQIYNINGTLPKYYYARSASSLEKEREGQYRWTYFEGVKRASLNLGYDLMSIVAKYNPILIKDSNNKVLVAESSLYKLLGKYRFLEDTTGLSIKITKDKYLSEKNRLIRHFVNRENKKKHTSLAPVIVQFREVWAGFSSQKKRSVARHMKDAYLASRSEDVIFDPIFAVLWANLYQQQLAFNNQQFINQMLNDMNSRHAKIIDDILDDFTKFTTRQSLQIGGATILQDRDNSFIVEYEPGGIRYEVGI